jgi:hypothetical protein
MARIIRVATALLVAFLIFVPAALAADPSLPHNGRVILSTQGGVSVPAGEHYDAVIVINADATVAGEVNTIVVVDGTANLSGARTESVLAVRSDVTLGPGTVVLNDVMTVDALVNQLGNAQVHGSVRDVTFDAARLGLFLGSAALLLYVGFGVAAVAAGLLLAGLAPRQVRAAGQVITRQPVQAFLAGILGMLLPIVVVIALFVTIVGAPLAFGILCGLWPLAAFAGYLVTAIWIGEFVVAQISPATQRERPYAAAVVGVIALGLLGIWPFLAGLATMFGYGAVLILAWRTLRGHGTPQVDARRPVTAQAVG